MGGGWKMTEYITEKAMVFYLQAIVSPLQIALGEILQRKLIAVVGVGIRMSWVEEFWKSKLRGGHLLGSQEYKALSTLGLKTYFYCKQYTQRMC